MRALSFVVSLVFSLLGLGAYLAVDYTIISRAARERGEEPISFYTYASGLVQIAGLLSGGDGKANAVDTVEALASMLPKPPEGWIMRPAEANDAEPFLPPGAKGEKAKLLRAVVEPRPGKGVTTAKFTYEKGARKVVIELVRYPDFVFTSFMAMAQKFELQMMGMELYGSDFATVRGLDIGESRLPDNYGARLLTAQVGNQIHLRILAAKSMKDEDLLPFLTTLNVPAMNASVVEKTSGLGEVPVIVLAAVLDAESRKAFEAEREVERQRRAEEQAIREAEREAERKREADAEKGITTDEDTGIKVRKGTGEGKDSTFETGGKLLDEGCRKEDSRKACGIVEEAEQPAEE
ncbi:hypothetical protein LHP98_17255 [Rhodobacter sp. Har01]|uniref:hypothetical protein n=1 Tax=Rhodobacter sp. Har01 TaxID=2883999 RepID=UPI001D07980D|nr:hypothetical protein [Rhodobacter sp. Har01]MCB6179872.1 hypothetical protein [Rhodobacter sp. Har01]